MLAKVFHADRGAQDRAKGVDARSDLGSGVWRRKKQNGASLPGYLLHARISGVTGPAKDVLDQQAAEAVADKQDGTLAEALPGHQVQHLQRATGQRHAVARIARAETYPPQGAGPSGGACGVTERPDANFGKLRSHPVRP